MKLISAIATTIVVAVMASVAVFIIGMRTKSPTLLNAIRRMNKEAINPDQMKTAGTAGSTTSVVRHVGRTTGRLYETPVQVVPRDNDFLIMLPYGMLADWLKNVLAAGSAAIVHDGHTYDVDRPEVVPFDTVADAFGPVERRAQRLFALDDCLRIRRVTPDETAQPASSRSTVDTER